MLSRPNILYSVIRLQHIHVYSATELSLPNFVPVPSFTYEILQFLKLHKGVN